MCVVYHCIIIIIQSSIHTAKSINAKSHFAIKFLLQNYDNEIKVVTLEKKVGTQIADLSHSFNQCGVFKGEVPVNWMFTDHLLPDSRVVEDVWDDLPTFS